MCTSALNTWHAKEPGTASGIHGGIFLYLALSSKLIYKMANTLLEDLTKASRPIRLFSNIVFYF
jgi:hypothetical protein